MKKLDFKKIFPFIIAALGSVLSFAVTLVLTNGLGKEKYGEIQYFIGIIGTFSAFSSFGVPNLLIRDQHLYQSKKGFFTSCLLLCLVFNLIAFPIFILVSYFAFSQLNKSFFLIVPIVVCSITSSLILVVQQQYYGLGKKNTATIIGNVAFKLLVLLVSTILLVTHLDSFLFDYFIYIYMGAYLIVLLPPLFKNVGKDLVKFSKAQFFSALFFMIISFCSGTTTQIAKILLGEAGDGSFGAVAVYSVSVQIVTVVSTFNLLVSSLARPKFAEFYSNGDQENLIKLYKSSLRLTIRFAIPIYIGIMVQQGSLFTIFGEGYVGYPLVFIFVAAGYLVADICGPCGTLLAMGHEEKWELASNVLHFISFLLIGILTVRKLYFAVPLAIFIAYTLSSVFRVFVVKKKFNFLAFDLQSLIEIIVELVISFWVFFLINFIGNIVIKIIVDVVVGVAMLVCLYCLPILKKDRDYFLSVI